jgi:hypothetical protein
MNKLCVIDEQIVGKNVRAMARRNCPQSSTRAAQVARRAIHEANRYRLTTYTAYPVLEAALLTTTIIQGKE